jgi:putative transposase
MPRGPRIAFENAFYHVFNRGLAKQEIFVDEHDYRKFLTVLEKLPEAKEYDHRIYAYVLMPNHFHLLIQTKKTPLSKILSSLATSYSMYFNRKYKRVGPLFQNRFKSKICQKDSYFLGASRYIHLNPVEAELVKNLKYYPWSSFQELYGKKEFSVLDKDSIDFLIGTTDKELKSYYDFLLDGIERLKDLKKDYSFEREIEGDAVFNHISQIKYLRRKRKKIR